MPNVLIEMRRLGIRLLRSSASTALRSTIRMARRVRILAAEPATRNDGQQESFLIIALTPHLGDAILHMPMVAALRQAHPEARIELATEESTASLWRGIPALDRVYGLRLGQNPPSTVFAAAKRVLLILLRYWQNMRHVAPQVCLLPRWTDDLFRGHVLALLIGAPCRIGFRSNSDPKRRLASYRDAFLTEAIACGDGLHEPQRYCLLLERAGLIAKSDLAKVPIQEVPYLRSIASSTSWPDLAQKLSIPPNKPIVTIAPAASHPRKEWPVQLWANILSILEQCGYHGVLVGGPRDRLLTQELSAATGGGATVAAGSTSLSELATLLAHTQLFLGNDSGPAHMAGALGVPSVVLYISAAGDDPNNSYAPERIRPIGPHVRVCRPSACLHPCLLHCEAPAAHCIQQISVEDVLQAIDSLIPAY